jgi:hypothetical protein
MTYKPEPGADPEQRTPETEIVACATVAAAATTSTFTPTVQHAPVAVTTAPACSPNQFQTKQGSKCCGCCCDYRQAVITLNMLCIIFGVIAVLVLVNSEGAQTIGGVDLDDDGLNDIVEDACSRQQAILAGVGVFFSIVAFVGACRCNVHMVGFNILHMIASFVATIALASKAFNALEEDSNGDKDFPLPIGRFVVQGLVMCVVIHSHVGFMGEVRTGILSAETCPREEFSCCCV